MSFDSPDLLEHIPHLRRYALSLLKDREKAEDCVQDCLVRAMERHDRFEPGTNLRSWLFRILHNLAIDELRGNARRRALRDCFLPKTPYHQPPVQEIRSELGVVARALEALPEDQRRCLQLVGVEGLSYGESADLAGMPVGTVKSRVSRARQALKLAMG